MDVTVEVKCGRCGKVEGNSLSLEAAQMMSDREGEKDAAVVKLPEVINQVLGQNHPDVVIAVRANNGMYVVESLDHLCAAPDAKRNKGCQTRVQTLLDDMFMRTAPKPKKAPAPNKTSKKNGSPKKEEPK